MKALKIKVCGMLHPGNIRDVAMLSPDLMGFIFYSASSRFAGALDPAVINELRGRNIIPTGVFVDEELPVIKGHIARFGLGAVQLHGDESPAVCQGLREEGVRVIKAFRIGSRKDFDQTRHFSDSCDCFLFDTATALKGGSGRKFDWSILDDYRLDKPFLLSGGIGPNDIENISRVNHPSLAGVDINSRFEIIPGFKDTEKVGKFLSSLREMQKTF